MKRIKRKQNLFRTLICSMLFLMLMSFGISAAAQDVKVNDYAGLMSDSEAEQLQDEYAAIAERIQCDVVLVTEESCGEYTTDEYAKEFYSYNKYGYGAEKTGVIMVVDMDRREFDLETFGTAVNEITRYGIDTIRDKVEEPMKDGEYFEAFRLFGNLTEEFIREARENTPYDNGHKYKTPMATGMRLLITLAAGIIIAAIVVGVLIGQLKSVGIEKKAQEYVRSGSFHVTRQNDIYLYRTVSRRKIEKESSSKGSSGSSSGGAKGHF